MNFSFFDLSLSQTSFQDRMERNLNGLSVVSDASFSNQLFGHGVNTDEGGRAGGRGLSSGLTYLLFEFGILISIFILALFMSFSNKNYTLIIIGILYLITIPWYRYYLSWYAIILCGLDYFNTTSYKKTFSKRNLKDYKTTKNLLS